MHLLRIIATTVIACVTLVGVGKAQRVKEVKVQMMLGKDKWTGMTAQPGKCVYVNLDILKVIINPRRYTCRFYREWCGRYPAIYEVYKGSKQFPRLEHIVSMKCYLYSADETH
ncbi:hypothetical protein FQN57_003256 [Myotisia sp. PD_48]|nr:hypothetical protein FQN57_003256 [Myotisia sp. PD_48]